MGPGPVGEVGGEREVVDGGMQGRNLGQRTSLVSDGVEKYVPRRPEMSLR